MSQPAAHASTAYDTGLWADARWWVECLAVFGEPAHIAAAGLSRRVAFRCRKWLWSIEGMVRRLIIAAALAIDPASLPAIVRKLTQAKPAATQPPEPADAPGRPTSPFRIFATHQPPSVERSGAAEAACPKPQREPPPLHRHATLPDADGLLAIGAATARTGLTRQPTLRHDNPLARRGRASRFDPDYSPDPEAELAAFNRDMFGWGRSDPDPLPLAPPPPKQYNPNDIYFSCRRSSDPFEWRRVEEEWARVIPAPDLGARIATLCRVLENPHRSIARLARLFGKHGGLSQRLIAVPAPVPRKTKHETSTHRPGLEHLAASHAAIPRPDTS